MTTLFEDLATLNAHHNATAKQIRDAEDALVAHFLPLQMEDLMPGQRLILGGQIFDEAPRVVRWVAVGLTECPERFSDLPIKGPDLLAQQERAEAYRSLSITLTWLAQKAQDGYLREQAAAAEQAMAVVEQVQAEEQCGDLDPVVHVQRVDAIAPALTILEKRIAKMLRQRPPTEKPEKIQRSHKGQRAIAGQNQALLRITRQQVMASLAMAFYQSEQAEPTAAPPPATPTPVAKKAAPIPCLPAAVLLGPEYQPFYAARLAKRIRCYAKPRRPARR